MLLPTSNQVVDDISDLISYGLTDEEIAVYLTGELTETAALQMVAAIRTWGLVPISYDN